MDQLHQYIYALRCPVDNMVHYVGRTQYPAERLKQHLNPSADGTQEKQGWLKMLRDRGLKPELLILQTVEFKRLPREEAYKWSKWGQVYESQEDHREVEKAWIIKLYRAGHPLAQRIPIKDEVTPETLVKEAHERGREFVANLEK